MTDKIEQTKKPNGKPLNGKWHPLLVAIVGAVVGSGGSIGLVFSTPVGQSLARSDPYTSIMADAAHEQIDTRLKPLERHVLPQNHPDQTGNFATRLATLEALYPIIIDGQKEIKAELRRMNERLDHMNE